MSYDIEFNARSVPPSHVAQSFIPPEPYFVRLLSRSHTLIVGPRGSGKTTLLKMLTLKALRSWKHPSAKKYSQQIKFNGALVPSDRAWGEQLEALDAFDFNGHKREAAFVLHTLRALSNAMREAVELGRSGAPPHLEHLAVKLDAKAEEEFVELLAAEFGISPRIRSLLGVELALEAKLNRINSDAEAPGSAAIDSFASSISLMISAFNGFSGDEERRWGLLFDELEIAPDSIKKFILQRIRSFDERVIFKVAMAPYMEGVALHPSPTSAQSSHDYHTVQLTYPNKDDAVSFSAELFTSTFRRLGLEFSALADIFGDPDGTRGFGRRARSSAERGHLPPEFAKLAAKDQSFAGYAAEKGLFAKGYQFNEENNAKDIRKVLPIVVAREFYLKKFEGGRVVANRSRKSHQLYTGYPTIVEVTEGNPRAILTLAVPLAQEHLIAMESNRRAKIDASIQAQAIRRVEFLLTSLLQVVPLDLGGFDESKGLLDFVDKIGRALEDRLLRKAFAPDYVGTFRVDDELPAAVITAVGRALNAGALVHVPYPDSGDGAFLRGLRGQRFRVSYALAARYRLLVTLGDRVNLSSLLRDKRGHSLLTSQTSFFDPEEAN